MKTLHIPFRFVVITAMLLSNIYAVDSNSDKIVKVYKNGAKIIFDRKCGLIAEHFAEKICNEDEDFIKSFIASAGSAYDKKNEGKAFDDFVINLPLNYGIRKGIRYFNGAEIMLGTSLLKNMDKIPGNYTKGVINPFVYTIAETITKPQVLTEVAKFCIFSSFIVIYWQQVLAVHHTHLP